MALKYHPDKQQTSSSDSNTAEQFQRIQFAYSILSDDQRRKLYDATGRMTSSDGDSVDWMEYFRGTLIILPHKLG